jgi:uncharacterized glyoxalase superfamily protein PhnB
MAVKPIPDGFNSVSAYIVVRNAVEALAFYNKSFGAETVMRMPGPDGKSTMHAEMRIGNSMVMLSEENPAWGTKSPQTLGGTPVSMHIYCDDVDALFTRAIAAGCTSPAPVMDMFWGDRFGKLVDPFGHEWSIATHKEDPTPEEIGKRAAAWFASMGGQGPST